MRETPAMNLDRMRREGSLSEGPRPALPADVSEAEFTRAVVALARDCGWMCFHQLPGMNRRGKWTSAVQGDVGFPDLVLARVGWRDGRYHRSLVFAELKSGRGKFSKEQYKWLDALGMAGAKVYTWRPADWPDIVRVLKGEG